MEEIQKENEMAQLNNGFKIKKVINIVSIVFIIIGLGLFIYNGFISLILLFLGIIFLILTDTLIHSPENKKEISVENNKKPKSIIITIIFFSIGISLIILSSTVKNYCYWFDCVFFYGLHIIGGLIFILIGFKYLHSILKKNSPENKPELNNKIKIKISTANILILLGIILYLIPGLTFLGMLIFPIGIGIFIIEFILKKIFRIEI